MSDGSSGRGKYIYLDILVVIVLIFVALPILDPDMKDSEDPLSFSVEWMDPKTELNRKFTLNFFSNDNSVEMYDVKLKRLFLSRIVCDGITERDFYLGNTVVVFSRRLLITDFANASTRQRLESHQESTFAMIKPDGLKDLGSILVQIEDHGFVIGNAKMTRLNVQQAQHFYAEHKDRPFYPDLVSYMTSGPVLALELIRSDAVKSWRRLLGPTDCHRAREESPASIRALYGTDKTNNAAHGSDSVEAAKRELAFFFPTDSREKEFSPKSIANFQDSTCCIIKPHAFKASLAGQIITDIQRNGFNISGLQSFHLKYEHAEEFFEIYKGVVQDYTGMVKQLSSGRCLVLEINHRDLGPETVAQFRDLVGPSDPELARTLRPKSLRARYGRTKDENALHCTDLKEDGHLEIEYFFKILQ